MPSGPEASQHCADRHYAEMYRMWLLECVFERGWTTVKCARMLKADPANVLADFERFAAQLDT